MIKDMIMAMLVIVIGVSLVPTVNDTVSSITVSDPALQGLVDLLPILFVVVVVSGAIGYVTLKNRG